MSNENDAVLVNRNGNTYQTTVEKMAELQDNDLVLVNREGTTYTITGEEIRESITNEIAPNITSVILEQDQTNGDRYTSNSFTSTVNYSEDPFPPASVEMVAKVEGVLGLDAGTSAIVQNNYPGTTSTEVELQLTNTQFIDDGVFEVGDEVKANESYTPETGVINSARVSQYDSSFGTSGTIDISALPGGEVFTIISVGPGFSGGRGNGSRGSTEPRGGAGASGGGAGPLYYRTFTREEYIAEYGNTYTQSLVNNFGGLLGYGGGTNAPNSTSYCGACIGSTGPAYPIDQAILDEINEALGGAMVLSKGAGGSPGGTKNNNSHSGGSGGGGAGGLVVTSTSSITVPTIPKGEDGGASTDGRGGYGGNGGTGWGAGGGGGGGDGDNGEINMTGAGGVGQAGINIVSIGNGQTILTFTDDKDIELFQVGDDVGTQTTYNTEGRQVYYVNGIVNGRQFVRPQSNPEAAFDGNSGSRTVANSPNEENGIGMVWPSPTNFGGSAIKIKLATNPTIRFVVNDDWDTSIPTEGTLPAGVTFEGDDTFDITSFVASRGGLLSSVYVYSTSGTMGVNGFNNGSGWVSQTWAESFLSDVKVVSTSVADKRINLDGGAWDTSNQSEVWSKYGSNDISGYSWSNTFDGDTTTQGGLPDYNSTTSITFPAITATKVEIYGSRGTTRGTPIVINNGTNAQSEFEVTPKWVDVTSYLPANNEFTGWLNDRTNSGNQECIFTNAVRVDGRILVDGAIESEIWSNYLTTPAGFSSGGPVTNCFDGSIETQTSSTENSGATEANAFVFTPPTPIPYQQSIEVYYRTAFSNGEGAAELNGGQAVFTPLGDWATIASGSGTITELKLWINPNTSGIGENAVRAIKVDGKLLIDQGIRDLGPNRVSTVNPKQGQGTISDISGAAVTIEPFTDNCFKEGQYLIHSTPKPILITPQTDAITEILTLADDESIFKVAGDKDLLNFVEDDKVYMCDSGGVIQEKNYTTSAVTATGVEDNYLQLYGANVTTGFNPGYDPLPNDYKQRIWDGDPNSAPQINQARTGDSFQVIFGGGGLPVPAGSTFQVTMPSVPDSFGASSYTVYINGDQSNSITDNNTPDNQIAIFNFGEVPGGVVTQVNTSCSWAEQRTTWGPSGFRINQETLVNDPKNYIYFADNSEFDKFSPGEEIATGVTIEAIESDEDKWQVDTFVGISNGQTFSTVPFQISADVVSVDVPEEQMTVDNVTDGWETTYFIKTLEKPAISQIGYLMFGSNGNITGVTLYPQDPVVMTSSNPRLTFPATFGTGITPDAELPYPASLSTTITSKNLFSDGTLNVSTADSNKLFPLTTTYAAPASGTSAYTTAGVAQLTANLSTFSGRAAAANSDPTDVQSALAAKQTEIDDYIAGL